MRTKEHFKGYKRWARVAVDVKPEEIFKCRHCGSVYNIHSESAGRQGAVAALEFEPSSVVIGRVCGNAH